MAKISVVNSSDDKSIAKLSDFLGVDFSSSIVDVNQKRASYMLNMINDNGINKKRPGYKTILEINETHGKLVACFELAITLIKNESYFLLITDMGKYLIYKVTNYDFNTATLVTTKNVSPTNQNYYCFNKNNKSYILGGGYYHVVYLDSDNNIVFKEVHADENTYIPTTTIGITQDGAMTSYENINALINRRKNRILGVASPEDDSNTDSGGDDGGFGDGSTVLSVTPFSYKSCYTLDSAIDSFFSVKITIQSLYANIADTATGNGATVLPLGSSAGASASTQGDKNLVKSEVKTTTHIYNGGKSNAEYDFTSDGLIKIDFNSGIIYFTIKTDPPIEGQDNITVEFTPKGEFDADIVDGNTFGIQFGAEGYEDRLFLAGNPNNPNSFIYSQIDDFTYFPAMNVHTIGNVKSSIVAFSRLNDSTLAIHTKNNYVDPTIWYLSPKEVIKEIGDEQISVFEFGLYPGVVGETPVNNYTNYCLSGDCIFLSANGIFGIELSSNVSSTERYERARSKYINKKLLEHEDLSNARAIVFQNRYYLAIDGCVYIADARFKTGATKGDMSNTFNYEYWYWDNIDVKQWLVINDKLCFIDSKHMLYQFDKEKIDRIIYKTALYNSGNFTLEQESNYTKIDFNSEKIMTEDGDKIIFSTGQRELFKMNAINVVIDGNVIKLTTTASKYIDDLKDGAHVKIGDSDFILNIINHEDRTFRLQANQDSTTTITYTDEYLIEVLDGESCYLFKNDDNSFYMKRFKDSKTKIMLIDDTSDDEDIIFYLIHYQNIPTKFYTGAIDFGTTVYSKNLHNVSIVLEPTIEGTIKFGYTTKKISREKESSHSNKIFDFNDFDFNDFTFETSNMACSRNFKCKVRNFNFIMFRFENDGDGDFAINNMSVIYSVGRKNKGVK